MFQTAPITATTQADLTGQIAQRLNTALTTHLQQAYAPDRRKTLRLFGATEAADWIGVSGQFLRKCHAEGIVTEPEVINNGRRIYSADEMLQAREALQATARKANKYVPRRQVGEKLQVIQLMNFKGGSAKSTSAIHLCHYLALRGFRVLAIDLDPQGSLSGFFGLDTAQELESATIYDAIRYEDPRPMSDVVLESYFPNLHLAPARLILSEFELETATAAGRGVSFFNRLDAAIQTVAPCYDVVILDSPPALGFLTLTGLYAASAVLVPMTPSMLDLASTQQFIDMTSAYIGVIEESGVQLDFDCFSFLITRDDPHDVPSQQIVSLMRALFQDRVLAATCLRSTAIADASMLKMSIYEVARADMVRATYDRVRLSMDAVGKEVEGIILSAWGRT
ncbi:MAG: plasmid partitioning protein RepA [Aestuariivita sp.]|nr:plasmid partitioning protein RepA [Aestuariivita sp.]